MPCVAALNCLQNSGMLTPRWPSAGPIGGEGLACPAGTCSLIYPSIFFAIVYSSRAFSLTLAKLRASRPVHIQARPEWPTENRHSDLEPRALLVDLFDEPVERSERPVGDAHLLADFEGDRRLRPLHAFLHLLQDATRFLLADGDRLVLGAEKPGHLRRALDQMIGLIVELHLDQHVARKELSLRRDLAPAAHLHDLFNRHKQLFDLVGEPGSSCTLLD